MPKSTYTPKPADVHAANLSALKERLKSGKLSGTYIFYGDEEYTKRYYYDELVKACGESSLNVKSFTDDFTFAGFVNACDTSPAGSMSLFSCAPEETETDAHAFRLVRLYALALDELPKADEKHFLTRVEDPDDGVILVFWLYAGEQDRLSKGILKKASDTALVVNFRHEANGSNMLISWILRHFTKAGITVDRNVAAYFNNYIGNDMTTLKNDIDNCVSFLRFENRDTLTTADVDFLCRKSTAAQIFDISSHALKGNYATAMVAYKVFRDSGEKALLVFGTLSKAVYDLCAVENAAKGGAGAAMIAKQTGLRDFVVRNYMSLLNDRKRNGAGISYARYAAETCLAYDTMIKSSRTDEYELLEELIFKLSKAPDTK